VASPLIIRKGEDKKTIVLGPDPWPACLKALALWHSKEKRNVMNTPSSVSIGQSKSVAFIITHTIKAGEEERYEAWLMGVLSAVSRAPGYLGREVFVRLKGRGRTRPSCASIPTTTLTLGLNRIRANHWSAGSASC
jgi:hypothetical protein